LHTRQSSSDRLDSSCVANIIVETLKRTIEDARIDLSEIAQASRTTSQVAGEVLAELTGLETPSGAILSPSARFNLAWEAVRVGAYERAMRALTWQEFEKFSEECLLRAGFKTQKGVIFSDGGRRWQIDLVGVKNQILLAVDCKHWKAPNYSFKFDKAVKHQKESLRPLIRHLRSLGRLMPQQVSALPMILTLFEPRDSLLDTVLLVSVVQLSDLLEHITPFDSELPFIVDCCLAESSIREDIRPNEVEK
jgi:restriction endonuclease